LHDAAKCCDPGVARLLLRHGANPNMLNGLGQTPLELALRPPHGVGSSADTLSVVEMLLGMGASPLDVDKNSLAFVDPEMKDLIARWSAWWRCRLLAWIRSRGRDHLLCTLAPELLFQVAQYM